METMILELLSVVSLLFSVLSLFFGFSDMRIVFLFAYVLGISSLFLWNRFRGKWIALLPTMLILPFFLEITWENGFFVGIYTLILLYYHVKVLGKLDHEDLISRFKMIYVLMILTMFLGLLMPRLNGLVLRSIPFMLIYFFTTIILSASLRHEAAGIDPRKNRQKVILYLSLALFFSITIGVRQVRGVIFSFFNMVGGLFQRILFMMIYPVIYGISWVFTKIMGLISVPLNMEYEEEEVLGQIEEGITQTAEMVKESRFIEIIFALGVGALILFFVFRYIKAMTDKKPTELPYEEQRDFILASTDKAKRKRRDKFPSDPKGQMRYYYRQYLRQLSKKTSLEKQDTSLSIKEKGKDVLNQNEEIRNLYIKYRYTDLEVNAKVVEEMKSFSKEND